MHLTIVIDQFVLINNSNCANENNKHSFFQLFRVFNDNGMLPHAYGRPVNLISLQTYIAPALVEMPGLLSRRRREAKKGFSTNVGAIWRSVRK